MKPILYTGEVQSYWHISRLPRKKWQTEHISANSGANNHGRMKSQPSRSALSDSSANKETISRLPTSLPCSIQMLLTRRLQDNGLWQVQSFGRRERSHFHLYQGRLFKGQWFAYFSNYFGKWLVIAVHLLRTLGSTSLITLGKLSSSLSKRRFKYKFKEFFYFLKME